MKVKELIDELQALNPELEVLYDAGFDGIINDYVYLGVDEVIHWNQLWDGKSTLEDVVVLS